MYRSTRAKQFDQKTQMKIWNRDVARCVLCAAGYHMEEATDPLMLQIRDIMHIVPKSQGGLGIEQNGVVGCRFHHHMMDNGKDGRREEMLEICREHLRACYPDFDETQVVYDKWAGLRPAGG